MREDKALTLMDAIRKSSLMPARRLEAMSAQMRQKGRVKVGADADISVFDPARVIDKATFENPERVMGAVLVLMAVGMAVWLPATFAPMAVFVAAAHFTRQTIPFRTEDESRWFRIAKWTAMVVAALLPVLLRARAPWDGAFFLAFLFVLFDLRSISLRRKLPVEQWPGKLYW